MKLQEIIDLLEGKPHNIPSHYWQQSFLSIKPLDIATQDDISFLYDKKYLKSAMQSQAAILIVPEYLTDSLQRPLIMVDKPRLAVLHLLNKLYPQSKPAPFIAPTAVIAQNATVQKNVSIGHYAVIDNKSSIGEETIIEPHVYIGKNVRIGQRCQIHSGVAVYDNCDIGNDVILHSGVVIGSDGFGYLQEKGTNLKVPQLGTVIIEDDVEIGANTAIDRGMLGNTCIGKNTKIDNLVQIGHNVKIGKHCIIAGNTAIAGSVTIEDNVIIAGQVGIRDNITICKGAIVPARTGVGKNVPEKTLVRPEYKRLLVVEGRLAKYCKKIEKIEKFLEDSS